LMQPFLTKKLNLFFSF